MNEKHVCFWRHPKLSVQPSKRLTLVSHASTLLLTSFSSENLNSVNGTCESCEKHTRTYSIDDTKVSAIFCETSTVGKDKTPCNFFAWSSSATSGFSLQTSTHCLFTNETCDEYEVLPADKIVFLQTYC